MVLAARHVTVSIQVTPGKAYEFASDPRNLPSWAAGLSGSIENVAGEWRAESPLGKVTIAFVAKNSLGVLDHEVTLPTGVKVYNPMRVFANGDGSEVVFTVYRHPGTSDEAFAKDAQSVHKDLQKLKTLLE